MPHPDYPQPDPTPGHAGLWLSATADTEQIGTSPDRRYLVRVSRAIPGIIRVWWTTHLDDPPVHPFAQHADSPATRALTSDHSFITMSARDIPHNPVWRSLRPHPQLARAIANALRRPEIA